MSDELLDIFDDNMHCTGTAPRSVVHAKGFWHQTFHCWLLRQEGEKKFVIFQRRGPDKKVFPNALDITAAGHLISGEGPTDGLRELREELGISANYEDLIPLGIRCDVAQIGSIINREFCHTYLLETKLALSGLIMQPDEVAGVVQMELDDGLKLFNGLVSKVQVTGYALDKDSQKRHISIFVSKGDIIPRLDAYYLKIFIMAERYFEGKNSFGV